MSTDEQPRPTPIGEATVLCNCNAPSIARALISRWLDGRGGAQLDDDARLLVSELVTNSVRHADQSAGAPLLITASALDGLVRVEVNDEGHGLVRARTPDRDNDGGGFGLHLVDLISTRWGVNHEHSTQVWFELAARDWPA